MAAMELRQFSNTNRGVTESNWHSLVKPRHKNTKTGFTLIELIVTITVVAILMAIAAPSFKYVTTANRASSEINALLGDMQMARGEAMKEGQFVTICASIDGATCAPITAWNNGWIVFSGVPPFAAGDPYVKIQRPFSSTDTLASDHGITSITFNREGIAWNLGQGFTFTLQDSTASAQFTRCLSGTLVGALSTQIGGKPTLETPATC
jgi:type IV fimbrial biogenesis protein FimT